MALKNDCERDYIKEAFDKLYNCVMPYIDLNEFANADRAFKELDKKVHRRIHELEGENASLRATTFDTIDEKEKEINDLKKKIQYLETENADLRVTPLDANEIEALKKENSELKTRNERLNTKCNSHWKALFEARIEAAQYKKINIRQRADIDTLEKEINTLKKKIHDLEEETDNLNKDIDELIEENTDNATRIESLKKANSALRRDNEILWSKLEEADITKQPTRPWHGDGNAMAGARTCCESLVEKIDELEAEKAKLEARTYLSYGHDFKFGDKVLVPWSDVPHMYIIPGRLYNPRTENVVYVGKTQHLKWTGERFEIK